KNSEPAMKILMRNMGMTLYVAGKLRAEGLDNVQINMDWQHLLMNDEHLPEYAALLHSEGLLGHQPGNSGWGTFDDDNMLGTTAVKGLALGEVGAVLAAAHAAYPLSTPRPGWAEQDPEDWWRAAVTVLAQVEADAGPPAGIGLSGQMHGLVALDAGDRVLR